MSSWQSFTAPVLAVHSNPEGHNQYTGGGGGATSLIGSHARQAQLGAMQAHQTAGEGTRHALQDASPGGQLRTPLEQTERANKATERAERTGKAAHHERAQVLHEAAARAHSAMQRRAPREATVAGHRITARAHEQAARLHGEAASTTSNSWHPFTTRPVWNEWDESLHPRGHGGKFGSGGDSGTGGKAGAGGKGHAKDEGIDIEARPVEGPGKAGKGTADKPLGLLHGSLAGAKFYATAKAGMSGVDKWLAGVPSNKPEWKPTWQMSKMLKAGIDGAVKGIGAAKAFVGKVEHAVAAAVGAAATTSAAYTRDKIGVGVSKLPKPAQTLANMVFAGLRSGMGGARVAGKAGLQGIFVHWTVPQALAERVAKEKGANPDQAKKIRTALAGMDMKALEAVKLGAGASFLPGLEHALHFTHPLSIVVGNVPVATASYLAGNSVAHPIHTAVAAAKGIRDLAVGSAKIVASPGKSLKAAAAWVSKEYKAGRDFGKAAATPTRAQAAAVQASHRKAEQGPRVAKPTLAHHRAADGWMPFGIAFAANADDAGGLDGPQNPQAIAELVSEALQAHDFSDWYLALYCSALDQLGNPLLAIHAADLAYKKQPEDPSSPDDMSDDEAMHTLFGPELTKVLKDASREEPPTTHQHRTVPEVGSGSWVALKTLPATGLFA